MKHALFAALILAGVALADMMPPPPTPERLARTDLAVVAKVIRVEEKTVEIPAAPGAKEKTSFQVAVLEVKEQINGKPVVKTVKLAFSGGGRRFPLMSLKAGDERLFFLTRQHGTDYYRLTMPWDVESSLDGHLAPARRAAKVLASPTAALKSKDAGERTLAAGVLIVRYRTRPMAEAKEVKEDAVPAAESKLILEALAAADWKVPEYTQFTPRSLFLRLGLTEKDGWKVTNFATLEADAKKWLEANAGKYKMKKFTTGVTAEP